jgi:hypothetical protein
MVQFLKLSKPKHTIQPIRGNNPGGRAQVLLGAIVALLVFATLTPALPAQMLLNTSTDGDPDAVQLVRKAIANLTARQSAQRDYTYIERDRTTSEIPDGSTRYEMTVSNTYEIILLEGHPYRRHTELNGQPLPPEEEAKEQARLKTELHRRLDNLLATNLPANANSPIVVDNILVPPLPTNTNSRAGAETLAVFAFRKHLEDLRLPLEDLPDQFDFHLRGHEPLNGRECYVIEAKPTRRGQARSKTNLDSGNFRLTLWIDLADLEIAKARGEAIRDGLLSDTDYSRIREGAEQEYPELITSKRKLRYSHGTVIVEEWAKIRDEIWLPATVKVKGTELVSSISTPGRSIEHNVVFGSYEKFHVEAHILPPK